jgi:hypothetical protein
MVLEYVVFCLVSPDPRQWGDHNLIETAALIQLVFDLVYLEGACQVLAACLVVRRRNTAHCQL